MIGCREISGGVECSCCYTYRVVLEPLAHLLPISRQHQPIAHQVFERRLVKESCGEDHQSVKPATGLVQALSNKVSWEVVLKQFLVLKGIVQLHGNSQQVGRVKKCHEVILTQDNIEKGQDAQ